MATPAKPFDPSQYGATPVGSDPSMSGAAFDPAKYGATPVAQTATAPGGFRQWVDEQLAPGSEAGLTNKAVEAIKGGISGVVSPFLHPIETIKGMGAPIVASGMTPGGYPAFAPTGNQERDLQNVKTQEDALRNTVEADSDAINNHPIHTISSVVVPAVALHKAFKAGEALKNGGVDVPVGKLREAAQNSFGAGPRMTEKIVDAAGDKFVNDKANANAKRIAAFESNEDQFAKAKSQQMDDSEKFAQDSAATAQANQAQAAKVAEQNRLKAAEVEQHNATQRQLAERRAALEKQSDTDSMALGNKIQEVESNVGQHADKLFDAVREKVGNPEAPSDDLVGSVKGAETNILQGIPENVKEFRSILGLSGENEEAAAARADAMKGLGFSGSYDQLSNEPAGPPQRLPNGEMRQLPSQKQMVDDAVTRQIGSGVSENKPVTWDYLQSLKSRIDARLRGQGARTMNGDLKRALYSVRDSVVGEMGKMAEANGAGEDWPAARDFYRQYKEDFATPNGPSGSGSPVAQSLNAADPKNIRAPFLRTQSSIGNRGLDILRKYGDFGGNEAADLADSVVNATQERAATKPAPTKNAPIPKPAPVPKPMPEAPLPPKGTLKPIPPEAEAQPVDIESARYGKIRDKINDWRQMSKVEARTLGITAIPERVMAWAFDRPSFVDWVKKPTPADIRYINKLPPEVRDATLNAFKNISDLDAKQTGQPSQMSPELSGMLKVTGASGGAAQVPRNRREAKQSLEQIEQ